MLTAAWQGNFKAETKIKIKRKMKIKNKSNKKETTTSGPKNMQ